MKKAALLIMIITVFSKVFGFVREMVLSYFYGASNITDIYFIAQLIPSVVFSLVITSLTTAFIPSFSKIKEKEGEDKSIEFTNNIVNISFIISTVLLVLTLIFTEPLVKLFALGFEGDVLLKTISFTRISIFTIYMTGIITMLTGYLQIKENFFIPAFIGFPMTIVTIIAIVASFYFGDILLAYGILLATFSQLLLLVFFSYKKGYRYKFHIDFKDHHLKEFMYMVLPLFIGVAIGQINMIVDKSVASTLVEGSISSLNYAQKLTGLVQGLFVTSIATAMFPMISKMAAEKNDSGLKLMISESISGINLLVLPATIGFIVLSEPIVKLLFGRGAFDQGAIIMTSTALFFYSFGMIGIGLREVLSRVFYSLHDTKTPILFTSIGVLLNIALNLILPRLMGIGGLALSSSISAIFIVTMLLISLRKKIGPFGLKNISVSFIKMLTSSLIMGIVAYISMKVLTPIIGSNLSLVISILLGIVIYFISIFFMKIEEMEYFINIVKERLGKRKKKR